jgi:hypothetical protein
MTLAELFNALNRAGVRLANVGGQLELRAPAIPGDVRAGAMEHKDALLALLPPIPAPALRTKNAPSRDGRRHTFRFLRSFVPPPRENQWTTKSGWPSRLRPQASCRQTPCPEPWPSGTSWVRSRPASGTLDRFVHTRGTGWRGGRFTASSSAEAATLPHGQSWSFSGNGS